jgi:hypothetical protein
MEGREVSVDTEEEEEERVPIPPLQWTRAAEVVK